MWYFTFNRSHLIPLLWKHHWFFFMKKQNFFLCKSKLLHHNILHHGLPCLIKTITSACLFWTFHVSVPFYIHHFFHLGGQFTVLLSTWLTITQISHRWRVDCIDAHQSVWFSLLHHKTLMFALYPFIYSYIQLQVFVNHLSFRTVKTISRSFRNTIWNRFQQDSTCDISAFLTLTIDFTLWLLHRSIIL